MGFWKTFLIAAVLAALPATGYVETAMRCGKLGWLPTTNLDDRLGKTIRGLLPLQDAKGVDA